MGGRKKILEIKLKEKPLGSIDYDKIGKHTGNYSGADIEAIVDIAVEKILEEAIASGIPKPLNTTILLQAVKKHNPTTQEWFMTAKNYATFANQSGTYDPILDYMKKRKML